MSEPATRHSMSIINLGVADLDASIAFYTGLGWHRSSLSDPKMCTFIVTPSTVLGLVPYELLVSDSKLGTGTARPPGFAGVTLSINGHSREDVDDIIARAESLGAVIHQRPEERDWGGYPGYSAYFLDLDGYPWEVAFAPFIELDAHGRFRLPR